MSQQECKDNDLSQSVDKIRELEKTVRLLKQEKEEIIKVSTRYLSQIIKRPRATVILLIFWRGFVGKIRYSG